MSRCKYFFLVQLWNANTSAQSWSQTDMNEPFAPQGVMTADICVFTPTVLHGPCCACADATSAAASTSIFIMVVARAVVRRVWSFGALQAAPNRLKPGRRVFCCVKNQV